jgi:hypothetical protein
LLATISTPLARPVIAGVRLRRGKAADVRGAARFVTEALATAAEAGCTGITIVRADSKFYTAEVVAACRRYGAHFSLSTGMNPSIRAAISRASNTACVPNSTKQAARTRGPASFCFGGLAWVFVFVAG